MQMSALDHGAGLVSQPFSNAHFRLQAGDEAGNEAGRRKGSLLHR